MNKRTLNWIKNLKWQPYSMNKKQKKLLLAELKRRVEVLS